jgi:DNA-directed RNA polymerase specialized sigma24 family protein
MKIERAFVKKMIRNLPPIKAIPLLESFMLPKREHDAILYVDIKKFTIDEAADILHTTSDTLKRRRKRAFDNIAKSLE